MSTSADKDPGALTYWRLLAISVNVESTRPELYAVIHEGEQDIPLLANGRIALFADPSRAPALILQYGAHLRADEVAVAEPFFWCDVPQTLYFLSNGGVDAQATVLGTVNVLLDLVKASGIALIEARRTALYSIADYCTTSNDITRYLEEEGDHSGRELIDAVLWCVGAVAVKATIL